MSIAKHYETGESLPEDIYRKLLAARTFRAGSLSLRQVSATCCFLLCLFLHCISGVALQLLLSSNFILAYASFSFEFYLPVSI